MPHQTYYRYTYNATKEAWELEYREVPPKAVPSLNEFWAETAVEAARRAYDHCEKMREAMLSHAKRWQSLGDALSKDNQWRLHTPCRRSDGAMLGDYCKTHETMKCFRK